MTNIEAIAYYAADAFNKTALGVGVLFGFYLLYTGYYLRGAAVFCIGVPAYFWLYRRFGGIPEHVE